MKKQSNLSRLMGYAGKHRILTYLSWVLSAALSLEPPQAVKDRARDRDRPNSKAFFMMVSSCAVTVTVFISSQRSGPQGVGLLPVPRWAFPPR